MAVFFWVAGRIGTPQRRNSLHDQTLPLDLCQNDLSQRVNNVNTLNFLMYCGTIVVHGEPMFVASLVTLAHEFPSTQTYYIHVQSFVLCLFKLFGLHYQQNCVPMNQENLASHEHWPKRIKMIPQYLWIPIIIWPTKAFVRTMYKQYAENQQHAVNFRELRNSPIIMNMSCCKPDLKCLCYFVLQIVYILIRKINCSKSNHLQ